jgi:hypothetical protein
MSGLPTVNFWSIPSATMTTRTTHRERRTHDRCAGIWTRIRHNFYRRRLASESFPGESGKQAVADLVPHSSECCEGQGPPSMLDSSPYSSAGAEQSGQGAWAFVAPSVEKADVSFRMLVMWIMSSRNTVRLFLTRSESHSKLLRRIAKGGTLKIADRIWRFQSPRSLGRVIA